MRSRNGHVRKNPREEKEVIREKVESILGPTERGTPRRPDWLVSSDRRASVFVTFSKGDQLFYDISKADLLEWRRFPPFLRRLRNEQRR